MSRIWEKTFAEEVPEKTTHVFKDGIIKDELGVAIPLADIGTVKLWLYRQGAPTVFINSRQAQDIKNVNGGTIASTGGAFTLVLGPLDNVLASQSVAGEMHEIYIEYTYNSGAKTGAVLWRFRVVNNPIPS